MIEPGEVSTLKARLSQFARRADAASATIFISRDAAVEGAADGLLAGRLGAVKDNMDVAGSATTAACPEFSYRAERSAQVVERALAEGATIVGKTNLDQFACGLVGTRSPYGAVPNSFDRTYISGGSSSGSAVAVALGLVDFAFGTDTAGSGRVPAGLNNIVGLKPSRGLLSCRGVFPACQHIDCVSIFTREVSLAVDVLAACAGFDAEDPFSRALMLDAAAMPEAFRFAVPDSEHLQFFGDHAAALAFQDALTLLQDLGGIAGTFSYAPLDRAAQSLYEGPWVAERYEAIGSFMDRHPEALDPVVRGIIEKGRHYSAADVFGAMRAIGLAQHYVHGLWKGTDVLVVPTAPIFPTIQAVHDEPLLLNRQLGYYTNFVNLLDLAAIAVPASMRADGLPFGITLIGRSGSELRLADLAQRFHGATGMTQGATSEPLAPARAVARPLDSTVCVAVVGAHLSGLSLNYQLIERGARLVEVVKTAPCYRLYALPQVQPPKPGLVRTPQDGAQIIAELWEIPVCAYGSFIAGVPAPLGIGTVKLHDGRSVQGFLCESAAVVGARDISEFGGWRAYLESLA